jgi:tRNA(His) 5'-end guanylyltransferase
MDQTAIKLCESIQGAKLAFVQSDEISIILTDFDDIKTDAWFGGNIQKIVSVSASIATATFNSEMHFDKEILAPRTKVAYFDSRVFTLPNVDEVINYLIWRQNDATRNSIQMAAQVLYSQKQLHQKDSSELQELIFQKGINWNDYPIGFKRGRIILKEKEETVGVKKFKLGEQLLGEGNVVRKKWASFDPPIFTQEPSFVLQRLPTLYGG